jgi:hypothetical protein
MRSLPHLQVSSQIKGSDLVEILSSCLVTLERYDDEPFLRRLSEARFKWSRKAAWAARSSNNDASPVVAVHDIFPSNCTRKAYYYYNKERVLEEGARRLQEPVTPSIIKGLAVEAAPARMLFPASGDAGSQKIERHKRYERNGIVCRVDLAADSNTIIEVRDTSVGRRLVPADIQFKGYLMQVLYYLLVSGKEEAILVINYSSKELLWHHNDSEGRSWLYRSANAKGPGIEC